MTIKIAVHVLTRTKYSSHAGEQAAFERCIAFNQPIAELLATQPPGTMLNGDCEVFWLTRQPGNTAYDLVHSFSIDPEERFQAGMQLDMIEGLSDEDMNEIADRLQQMVQKPTFVASDSVLVPLLFDNPVSENHVDDVDTFEVVAHDAFKADPMTAPDPRTLELGEGWEKIGKNHWLASFELNGPRVHLELEANLWRVSVRHYGGYVAKFENLVFDSFNSAKPAAIQRREEIR